MDVDVDVGAGTLAGHRTIGRVEGTLARNETWS